MADVVFGFVHDFGPARSGWPRAAPARTSRRAAWIPRRASAEPDGGKLEVIGIESADPRWVAEAADDLRDCPSPARHRVDRDLALPGRSRRASTAWSTLKRCRAVDAAAGQLIVREAGGMVAFTGYEDPLAAPLDVTPRSPVIAARTERALTDLRALPRADLPRARAARWRAASSSEGP